MSIVKYSTVPLELEQEKPAWAKGKAKAKAAEPKPPVEEKPAVEPVAAPETEER